MSKFTFNKSIKKKLAILMISGVVLFTIGLFTQGGEKVDHGHGHDDHHASTEQHDDHQADPIHEEVVAEATEVDSHYATDELAADSTALSVVSTTPADNHDTHAEHDEHAANGHEAHLVSKKQIVFANLYAIIMFAFWVGVAGIFFLAAATTAWGGWHITFQKVPLALSSMIPVTIVLGVIVFIFGYHDLFEWTHSYLYDVNDPRYDELLNSKRDWLNLSRFSISSILYIAVILLVTFLWWKKLKEQDVNPTLKAFSGSRNLGAVTIAVLAVINAFGTWDWVMSIEPHWYSTLYAWYLMASAAVTMFASVILILLVMQKYGYFKNVNENHFHDLGKFCFAISVFWTYLWFSQHMLIWYANIPEETLYFKKRIDNYKILFYGAWFINFILPFFMLMKRSAKRNKNVLIVATSLIIIGHWLDFFNMIVAPIATTGGFGLISIGLLLFALGFFGFIVFTALTKVEDLESTQHPYFKESLQHHI